jgi:hypothetical protein
VKAAAFPALLLAALLALQEAVLRFVFPLPELSSFNRIHYMQRGLSLERNAATVRNVQLVWVSAPDHAEFVNRLNLYGFRDRTWRAAKPPGVRRIAFVGDSYVEGLMAAADETIPAGFARCADRAGIQVETMNLGVAGVDLAGEIRIIQDATLAFRPDTVFLVLSANDLTGTPEPPAPIAPQRFNPLKPRLLELWQMWRRREMLPLRRTSRRVNFLAAVPDPDNPLSDPEHARAMAAHAEPWLLAAMLRGEFNPRRIGGSGLYAPFLKHPVAITRPLEFLDHFTADHDVEFCLAYLPERGQATGYYRQFDRQFSIGLPEHDLTATEFQQDARRLAAACRAAGIPFLDLTPRIRAEEEQGHHLYWDYDDHMRGEGYLLVGRQLCEWWQQVRRSSAGDGP